MKIINNLLKGDKVKYVPCPKNTRPMKELAFIIIHYTATTKTDPTVSYLKKADSGVSAHFVIGRNGEIIQLVPCDTQAWHAGESMYKFNKEQFNYLNNYSIGIELVNAGKLNHICDTFYSCLGKNIPKDEVFYDRKENRATKYWHDYTDEQISSLINVIKTLRKEFPQIRDVLGHSDITSRKIDPGKAFPWVKIKNIT